MINPDMIPPEVMEAAARAVYETWCAVNGVTETSLPWSEIDDEEREACFAEARAAIAAALAAWPDSILMPAELILPLPQETRDAES